jgi:hypothetical protein
MWINKPWSHRQPYFIAKLSKKKPHTYHDLVWQLAEHVVGATFVAATDEALATNQPTMIVGIWQPYGSKGPTQVDKRVQRRRRRPSAAAREGWDLGLFTDGKARRGQEKDARGHEKATNLSQIWTRFASVRTPCLFVSSVRSRFWCS